jgi:hypothetical protein
MSKSIVLNHQHEFEFESTTNSGPVDCEVSQGSQLNRLMSEKRLGSEIQLACLHCLKCCVSEWSEFSNSSVPWSLYLYFNISLPCPKSNNCISPGEIIPYLRKYCRNIGRKFKNSILISMLPSLRRWNKGAPFLPRNICSAIYFSSNHSQCWTFNIFENHCRLKRLLLPHLVTTHAVGAGWRQRQTTFCPTPTQPTEPPSFCFCLPMIGRGMHHLTETETETFQTFKQIMRTMASNLY